MPLLQSSQVAKKAAVFSCTECGNQAPKWLGRCPECNAWNSYAQEEIARGATRPAALSASAAPMPIDAIEADVAPRISTNLPNLDPVLGRGLVIGGVTPL